MAYRQNNDQYLTPNSPPQHFPPPRQSPQLYQPQVQLYPQVVIPSYSPHTLQSPSTQSPLHPQAFTQTQSPASSFPLPPFPPQYSAPPHAFQYDGHSAAPGLTYAIPNRAAPYPVYLPEMRPQSQPQPPHLSPSYPVLTQAHSQSPIPQPVLHQNPPADLRQKPSKSHNSQTQSQVVQRKAMAKKAGSRESQKHQSAGGEKTQVDYQLLLLALADEYLDAAHSQASLIAASRNPEDLDQYYKLVATGLQCMKTVLKNWRLAPRTEALVRLRYARILYEETNNDTEAETTLSKGIDLCERNRMFDLKYAMQQQLCQVLSKSNPKAAMKTADGIIHDIEAYRHAGWEYAFRFLRVSLSLSSPAHLDIVGAIHNLQKISSLASRSGNKAIFVIGSVIEALIHLQQSSSSDSIEHAQRAIATARSQQLDSDVKGKPQLNSIIQMVDICCSVLEYDINQATQKLKILQQSMDRDINNPQWRDDGSFSLTMNPSTIESSLTPEHIDTGHHMELTLSWLAEHDLYALCYFLSSVTFSAKNSQDGHKAEKYLEEGLGMIKDNLRSPQGISESLGSSVSRLQWRRTLYCNMRLQQLFLLCARTEWNAAKQVLKETQSALSELEESSNSGVHYLAEYACGIISQSAGDLMAAKTTFRQPIFSLAQFPHKGSRSDPRRDIAILANLNLALITRDPSETDHSLSARTVNTLKPHCETSQNKYIQAAYSLISATVHTESTIQTKHNLQQALQTATTICNNQITCLALTFMSWKYFRGVMGEQSEKSAMAARATARKADDKLWISVTEDLLAETLDRQGKSVDAQALRRKADKELEILPPALKHSNKNGISRSNSNGTPAAVYVAI
ncbi:hypothetical protein FQN57_006638 [Myotisia sp. PD_48]|nr:hypothetical protein FQN57_006638 [Myotisia sp. PD_48]